MTNEKLVGLLTVVDRVLNSAAKWYGAGVLPKELAHLLEFELLPEYLAFELKDESNK